MFEKIYLSRAQTRAMAAEMPIGDPTGGAAYGERNDPVTATVASVGSSLAGGLLQNRAASKAADAQRDAAMQGIQSQETMYRTNREDMAPWRQVGSDALYQLRDMTKPGGYLISDYTGDSLRTDPGYQFGLDEGRNAIDQSAASRGILFSGKTLRDLMKFGQDYAGTKFNEGFNRDMATKGFRQQTLAGLSGTGSAAAGQTAALGAQTGNSIADLLGSAGAARAAGLVGGANALSGAIGNAGNAYLQMSMLDKIMGRGGGTGMTATPTSFNGGSYFGFNPGT